MTTNRFGYAAVLACLPFLTSCYFTSLNPLPPAEKIDSSLLGLWQSHSAENHDDQAYLLMTCLDNRIWITVFEGPFNASEMYLGYCSEVNGMKYLSVQRSKPDRGGVKIVSDNNFYLVRYDVSPKGQLEIRLLNDEPFRKAVAQKRLSGELLKDDLHLTASSRDLALILGRSKPITKTAEEDRLLIAVKIPLPAPAPKGSPTP